MATLFERKEFRKVNPTQTALARDEDLKCSVCLDLLQDPRLLPCLHAYCLKCLEGIHRKSKDKKSIKCPQCRKDYPIPIGGVSVFPLDQILTNAVQVHAFKSKQHMTTPEPPQCSMCAESDPATGYCLTCGKYLCDFCQRAHRRQLDFRSHKITALSEMDPSAMITAGQPSHCPSHSGELLKLYCKTCEKLICRDCTIVNHRTHEFGFVNELRPQLQKETNKIATVLKRKQQEFEAHLHFLKDMEKGQNESSNSLETDIRTKLDAYIKAIQDYYDQLIEQVKSSKEANMKQIWAEKEYVETTLAGISCALRYIDRLSSCSSDQVMLAMRSEAAAQLSSLQSAEWKESKLKLSIPQALVSTLPKPEQCLSLNNVSPQDVSVSIKMLTCFGQPPLQIATSGQHPLSLGERAVFIVEVKCANVPSPIVPAISVSINNGPNIYSGGVFLSGIHTPHRNTRSNEYTNYSYQYKGKGVWNVELTPTYPGTFVITATVENILVKEHTARNKFGSTGAWQQLGGGLQFGGGLFNQAQQKMSSSYIVNVTGMLLKVGDRVCRGPSWSGGDEDGGAGSEGTVVQILNDGENQNPQQGFFFGGRTTGNLFASQTSQLGQGSHTVQVQWDNGNARSYNWNTSQGLFPIQLITQN